MQNPFPPKIGLAFTLLLIGFSTTLLLTGCGSTSIFQGLSGGGSTESGVSGATKALNNGNYTEAINKANDVISNSSSSTSDRKSAYTVKGEALLGSGGLTISAIATSLSGSSTEENSISQFPTINLSTAIASAEAINTAFSLTNEAQPDPGFGTPSINSGVVTAESLKFQPIKILGKLSVADTSSDSTSNRYLVRMMANLESMMGLLTTVYNVTTSGDITLKDGYTAHSSLDYLYPPDSSPGVLYYASIVAVTYPFCNLSAEKQNLVLRAINATVYISYIHAAMKDGNPFIYKGSDGRIIRPSSTDDEILSAVQFELKKVHP